MSLIVAALGGNAIIRPGQKGTIQEQFDNTFESMGHIAHLVRAGHRVVLTHGNGPQVGFIMVQVEAARGKAPYMPLNVDVAQSQGSMGYMIAQSLINQLKDHHLDIRVAPVVTQVLVDPDDPAFEHPTKPVGPFYSRVEADEFERCGHIVVEDSGRGWRRVVASPVPVDIVEAEVIRELVADGVIVVACGGGGIPVVEEDGDLKGVDAVIDKDLASSLLAAVIGADVVMFLTTVDKVSLNYNTPGQVELDRLTVEEARVYLAEGQFPPGSMGPKIQAAVEFVEQGGERAVVCRSEGVVEALEGRGGTVVEG
ncbi:MAG: carbamate kinase [ANME-2 cluster archaeon]|nr:carbamate kinase [ANME-2 cluster archaeon]MBC2701240.1 carbamate kinase [ANME-2 cluster archaeon]MBC2708910.1 carbamate kinase [ANME-2 cluster archaeon]MBC2746772.1 carbamate kinase [ANME-2 cluster archaeon]MBC2762953.1 carbamate kinase [ANME-2 cluster archaeon]